MARYRIHIDRESCIGDKQCGEEAPNTFFVDDEGVAMVIDPEGDPPEQVLAAAAKCWQHAISLIETATGKRVEVDNDLVVEIHGREGDESHELRNRYYQDLGGGD